MIEVFAETALANEIEQLHVAGGDDANVDLDRFRAAEAHEFAFLNDPQELCLRMRSDRGNLIEKNRPLICYLEEPFLRRHGACQRALHVAEQLRFEPVD